MEIREGTMTTEQNRTGVGINLDQRFGEAEPPLIECMLSILNEASMVKE